IAPAIGAHDEDLDRRLFEDACVLSLQPVIEPAELHRLEVRAKVDECGLGAESEIELPDRVRAGAVGPRTDQKLGRDATPAHLVEVVDGALEEDVVPTAGVEAWHVNLGVLDSQKLG